MDFIPMQHKFKEEIETYISYNKEDDIITIYTTDNTEARKFIKNVNEYPEYWKCKEVSKLVDGTIASYTFEVNKKCLHISNKIRTKNISDEQKQAMSNRVKKMWQDKKNN